MRMLRRTQLLSWSFSKIVSRPQPAGIDITKTTPSVMLSQDDEPASALKPLTPEQKQQLGLMIVRPPFNVRMSLQKQLDYRVALTTDLYSKQLQQLEPKVRILELPREGEIDMLKLTNVVYKDIYARYLVARGFGVRWQGDNSSVGGLNPEAVQDVAVIYHTYLKTFKEADLYIKKVPTLYSLSRCVEIPDEEVEIESINRIGGFFLADLAEFGSYEDQFRPLMQKNGRISMLLFTTEFWPVLAMKAVCLNATSSFIVLKHEQSDKYLVTALDHYRSQRKWFDKERFSKHLLVEGKNFSGMKARSPTGDLVPVIMELEEYNRQHASRIFPVVPAHVLTDYERAVHYKLPLGSVLGTNGLLKSDIIPGEIDVRELATEEIVKQHFQKTGLLVDLHDVCQEEIFLDSNKQILRLIPVDRLFLSISEKARQKFLSALKESCTIHESKVQIPKMPRIRGRERRRFAKRIGKLLEQRTEYLTLDEALRLEEICISTSADMSFPVPVFQKKGQLVMPKACAQQLTQLAQAGPVSKQDIDQINEPTASKKVFYLSKAFVKAAIFLSQSTTDALSNVIIEPQSQTESTLKYALTLAAGLNNSNFSLIKLHPTIDQNQRSLSVQTMIMGAYKTNDQRQYGYGFDAFRLWVAKKDNEKGDRVIKELDITAETSNANFLRKCYWQLLSYIKHINPTLIPNYAGKQRHELPFFDRFMLDQCDYYIANMQRYYNGMDLHKAHTVTMEFFRDIVTEIYLNSVTKRLIAYPKVNLHHLAVFRRLLECLAVVAPLIPFSAMHVSQESYLRWPKVQSINAEQVELYNKLINFRTELRNKLKINSLHNALVYVENGVPNVPQSELSLFLDVRRVIYQLPEFSPPEKFAMKKCDFPCKVYFYSETCYRCDPKYGGKEHLCTTCQEYLRQHPQLKLESS